MKKVCLAKRKNLSGKPQAPWLVVSRDQESYSTPWLVASRDQESHSAPWLIVSRDQESYSAVGTLVRSITYHHVIKKVIRQLGP